MATVTKKDKFFEVLRNIFVGAKIEGNSGYVNLMKIKSKYYNEFKEQLHTDIDAKLKEVGQNFEEELYNKLFTFFKKYFSESGSIYFSYTPLQEKVYERIYRDDKDVMLFWKTHMLYYVKTERLFKNMEVEDEDIIYLFDVAELQHKKSNEKKDLVFELVKVEHTDKRRIYFSVKYSKNGSKTKTEDILKNIKKEKAFGSITLKQVERVLGIYKRQSEVDYFINKDAKGFLKEQFSLWIKGYLLDDETLFEPARLNQLKALQHIAFNIIDLVGQFEDELVKVWNKPKFAHSSNYVITLDKIAELDFALLEKIIKHKGMAEQVKEWEELELVDKKFEVKQILNGKKLNELLKYLPLDTKFIKDLEIDILTRFNDLDKEINGWLIHSENYQALNTLRNLLYKKLKTIYIDPPFNTGSDFEYADFIQDSSWLSLIYDRLEISKNLLSDLGSFYMHLDGYANYMGRMLMDKVFGNDKKEIFRNELIWSYRSGGASKYEYLPRKHDTCFLYSKTKDFKIKPTYERQYLEKSFMGSKQDENGKYYVDTIMRDVIEGLIYRVENEKVVKKYNVRPVLNLAAEHMGFDTQKPEGYLDLLFDISDVKENEFVLDFFSGSGTTINVAHKKNIKWVGIELGNHINEFYVNSKGERKQGLRARLKKTLFGFKQGINDEVDFYGGGFFKYYSLEQYEETLSKIKYEDKNSLPTQDIYHQYLFLKDLKLADDVIKLDEKSKSIKVDLTKLHPAIDIPETLSHLTGKFIKQIKKDEVVFTDGTSIDLTNIDYKIVKPLIWW